MTEERSIAFNRLKWVKATDWGLKWYREQRLPDPYREITQEEYVRLWLQDNFGLSGVHFGQITLDWGKGPLMDNPKRLEIPMDRIGYDPNPGDSVLFRNQGTWMKGLFAGWVDRKGGAVTVDAGEFGIHDLQARDVHLISFSHGNGGWRSFENFWSTKFYWFMHYGLAIAQNYARVDRYKTEGVIQRGLGTFVSDGQRGGYGYAVRFFRLGCEHPTDKLNCPDCGWKEPHYDSSG